jgi:hypothetical protein
MEYSERPAVRLNVDRTKDGQDMELILAHLESHVNQSTTTETLSELSLILKEVIIIFNRCAVTVAKTGSSEICSVTPLPTSIRTLVEPEIFIKDNTISPDLNAHLAAKIPQIMT